MEEIINKVAQSQLVNLDLANFYPKGERVLLDIKDFLWQETILKEKEFRQHIKETDWTNFSGKYVAISCSVDAIVPVWAYMLIASQLQPYAKRFVFGDLNTLETTLFMESMNAMNPDDFKGERVIVNGCGEVPVPESAFVELVNKLKPVVKSIMYGEACSTVPIYKQPKQKGV